MRTVGTRLEVHAGQAKRELKDAERHVKSFEEELVDAAREGKATATSIADIGKTAAGAFPVAERAAAKLNGEIAETAREIQRLDREFRKTGDITLFGDLERQLRKLKNKIKARDFFDRRSVADAGAELAEGIGTQLMAKIGPVMARAPLNVGALGPVGGTIGAVLAVGLASTVSAALSGAVVGGAGVGGIAGGVALAARDPRVKAEAKVLGQEIVTMLESSSKGAFVPVVRQQIASLRKELGTFEPFLRAIFAKAAQLVDPLVKGFTSLARNALPGVVALIDRARPVIDVIAKRLPEIGEAISDALEDISGDSRSAAAGVDTILRGLIGIVRFSGQVIGFFTSLFRITVQVADAALTVTETLAGWNPLLSPQLEKSRAHLEGLKAILNDTGTAAADSVGPIDDLGGAVGDTAEEVEALNTAFDNLFGQYMDLDQATIAYKDGVVELKKELADGKRTLDLNTAAGRENAGAVLSQIEKINRLREARIAETGDVRGANRVYEQQIDALRRTMRQMGFTQREIDALIGKYRKIPSKVDTTIRADTRNANSQITGFIKRINTIDGRVITVRTRITSAGEYIPGQGTSVRRWGGITEHAQTGLLREAHIASPMSRRYGYAEMATGGEAFIPRFGNYERNLGIWAKVGRDWLGMRGGGAQMVTLRLIHQTPDGRVLREQLIDYAGRTNTAPIKLWPTS